MPRPAPLPCGKRIPSSPYADQADLALARAAVDSRDFDEAAKRLRAVVDGSRDAELRQVARMRLARVLIEQAKHDEALALLDPRRQARSRRISTTYAATFSPPRVTPSARAARTTRRSRRIPSRRVSTATTWH